MAGPVIAYHAPGASNWPAAERRSSGCEGVLQPDERDPQRFACPLELRAFERVKNSPDCPGLSEDSLQGPLDHDALFELDHREAPL
jgi:hypothetical protein